MLISIITVVFNAAKTIENTIKSVVGQVTNDIEYLIVDGGSTDGTVEIIKAYQDKISYWCSEPDAGIYDALNKSVLKARGKWLLFLGADDSLNDVLQDIIPYLKHERTLYYGNAYMNKTKINYAGKFNILKLSHQNICQQAIFYPSNVFTKYQFDLRNKVHADYELNLLVYSDENYKFEFIDKVICNYSEAGYSTVNNDTFYSVGRFKILQKRFPMYVYLYAKMRYFVTKLLKSNYD